jgi:hypothetical protein
MKKKAPKMTLSRETLRDLDEELTGKAAGAVFPTVGCSNGRATCYTCGADPGAVGAHPAVACA